MKIEILYRFTKKLIWALEIENNTIKKTIEDALKNGAELRRANLEGANLQGANQKGANL